MKQSNIVLFLYRYGRVNYVLEKRLQLLNEVQRLQDLMDVKGDMSYTCETAMHFFWSHVLPKWNKYLTTLKSLEENSNGVSFKTFIFIKFFNYVHIFRPSQ